MFEWSVSQISPRIVAGINYINSNISHYYADFFNVLFLTGCRPVELLEIERWSRLNKSELSLQTAKRGLIRTIPIAGLPSSFLEAVDAYPGDLLPFTRISKSTTLRFWDLYFSPSQFYFYDDDLKGSQGMYILRHIFVKNLIYGGMTYSEASNYMGETDVKNITGYYLSQAFSPIVPSK